jgi:hypothetical protein
MKAYGWIPIWVTVGSLVACGTSDPPDSVGAGGSGGGGSAQAGNPSGGSGGVGGGVAGTAPGGTGGTQTAPVGQHCDGGDIISTPYFSGVSSDCFGDVLGFDLPNPHDISVDDIVLPAALTPGVTSAVSFEMQGGGPIDIELWGTDAQCGKAKELLWKAPLTSKILCAELTPTMATTHLLFVLRRRDGGNFLSNVKSLGMCVGGSCREPDGVSATSSAPLSGAQVGYDARVSWAGRGGFDARLGVYGRMITEGEYSGAEGQTARLTNGIFRAPTPFEPYGDAFYCLGEGSTVTNHGEKGVELSLANITRLGTCEELKGTGTLDVALASAGTEVKSSLPSLLLTTDLASGLCWDKFCNWSFPGMPARTWIDFTTTEGLGDSFKPTLVSAPVREAAIFHRPTEEAAIQLACATSGTATYVPDGTSTLVLSDVGALTACPGKPIEASSVKWHLYD